MRKAILVVVMMLMALTQLVGAEPVKVTLQNGDQGRKLYYSHPECQENLSRDEFLAETAPLNGFANTEENWRKIRAGKEFLLATEKTQPQVVEALPASTVPVVPAVEEVKPLEVVEEIVQLTEEKVDESESVGESENFELAQAITAESGGFEPSYVSEVLGLGEAQRENPLEIAPTPTSDYKETKVTDDLKEEFIQGTTERLKNRPEGYVSDERTANHYDPSLSITPGGGFNSSHKYSYLVVLIIAISIVGTYLLFKKGKNHKPVIPTSKPLEPEHNVPPTMQERYEESQRSKAVDILKRTHLAFTPKWMNPLFPIYLYIVERDPLGEPLRVHIPVIHRIVPSDHDEIIKALIEISELTGNKRQQIKEWKDTDWLKLVASPTPNKKEKDDEVDLSNIHSLPKKAGGHTRAAAQWRYKRPFANIWSMLAAGAFLLG